jgi:hypothetical protein
MYSLTVIFSRAASWCNAAWTPAGSSRVTSPAEWAADPEAQAEFEGVNRAYQERITFLDKKAG